MAILAAVFLRGIVLWLIGNAMENSRQAKIDLEHRARLEELECRRQFYANLDYPGKKK